MSYGYPVTITDTNTSTHPAHLARIGALIRSARQHEGLTQAQLAELLGTSQSAIHRIEQGGQNITLDMLTRISAALDSEIVTIRSEERRVGKEWRAQREER